MEGLSSIGTGNSVVRSPSLEKTYTLGHGLMVTMMVILG